MMLIVKKNYVLMKASKVKEKVIQMPQSRNQ